MLSIKKIFIFILLIFFGILNFLIISLFTIAYLGILASIFFPNIILDNVIGTLVTFGDNGFVGLVALLFYFLPYFAYKYFLKKYEKLTKDLL